jgi:hypothetical protein
MSISPVQIAAARKFAPPLITTGQADRRGARLRSVNRRAVDYARNAGIALADVYPLDIVTMRALAPSADSIEASTFVYSAGLTADDVYPTEVTFMGEGPRRHWRWGWAAVGALVGAVVAGPIGAAVGVIVGGVR